MLVVDGVGEVEEEWGVQRSLEAVGKVAWVWEYVVECGWVSLVEGGAS